jgi:hypothetical protein
MGLGGTRRGTVGLPAIARIRGPLALSAPSVSRILPVALRIAFTAAPVRHFSPAGHFAILDSASLLGDKHIIRERLTLNTD